MSSLIYFALYGLQTYIALAQDVTIETQVGNIVGEFATISYNGTIYTYKHFLGIPYAEAPIGDRRFSKPAKKANFTEPFIAKTLPPFCPQNPAYLDFLGISLDPSVWAEDCLRLNIFTPENDVVEGGEKRPVMVWIHGGVFEAETQNWNLAQLLVAFNDIIYVTLNYRLSVLGFLSTGDDTLPGNYGMWDQHMAIQWVYDHIENFGGDPEKITIAGESSGSIAVIHHALYRGSKTLFNGVIAQSGSANTESLIGKNPLDKFNLLAQKTGCSSAEPTNTIACLQNKPLEDLLAQLTFDLNFEPVIDGEFIEIHPNDVFLNSSDKASDILTEFGKYDIVFGLNSDEGALFLGTVDELVGAAGYTQDTVKNIVIPFILEFAEVKDTPTLRDAIVNQYLDWGDPDNSALIRLRTVDLVSDLLFNIDVIKSAKVHSSLNSDGDTYLYIFDHRSLISIPGLLGANHAEEIIFALGFPFDRLLFFYNINISDAADLFLQDDLRLSEDMMEYWANFVKTG